MGIPILLYIFTQSNYSNEKKKKKKKKKKKIKTNEIMNKANTCLSRLFETVA